MNVAAIIVTRGDQDLTPIVASLPEEWPVVIWDNSVEKDLAVYGRYAAIARTDAELIYTQDDDCIVSEPQVLVEAWLDTATDEYVICNMPSEFRHDFYAEHALVGFGACFHRDAPERAFARFSLSDGGYPLTQNDLGFYHRTCDIVFTALTPRVLVDVPHENLPWAYHYDRMYRQPELLAERVRMLDLVRDLA